MGAGGHAVDAPTVAGDDASDRSAVALLGAIVARVGVIVAEVVTAHDFRRGEAGERPERGVLGLNAVIDHCYRDPLAGGLGVLLGEVDPGQRMSLGVEFLVRLHPLNASDHRVLR